MLFFRPQIKEILTPLSQPLWMWGALSAVLKTSLKRILEPMWASLQSWRADTASVSTELVPQRHGEHCMVGTMGKVVKSSHPPHPVFQTGPWEHVLLLTCCCYQTSQNLKIISLKMTSSFQHHKHQWLYLNHDGTPMIIHFKHSKFRAVHAFRVFTH